MALCELIPCQFFPGHQIVYFWLVFSHFYFSKVFLQFFIITFISVLLFCLFSGGTTMIYNMLDFFTLTLLNSVSFHFACFFTPVRNAFSSCLIFFFFFLLLQHGLFPVIVLFSFHLFPLIVHFVPAHHKLTNSSSRKI